MTQLVTVTGCITGWPQAREEDGRVFVPTHCLYPSNGVVVVVVEGGVAQFRVHDDAGALDELESAGGRVSSTFNVMRSVIRRQGLEVADSGAIISPFVSADELAATITLVANASKEVAHRLIDSMRPPPRRDFRAELERLLKRQFGIIPLRRHAAVIGSSNKQHRFDYAVQIGEQRQLLLDAVMPESTSINAAVVAHLDVKQAKLPNVIQRIVYDDGEMWSAADLNLLQVGAPAVAFSQASEVLKRIAA
jgi:hypothetical protein